MDAREYLHGRREKYVTYYRQTIHSHRNDGKTCTPEVWVQQNAAPGADAATPDALCVDLIIEKPEPTLCSVVSGDIPSGPSTGSLTVGDIHAPVFPFDWDACVVWARLINPDWQGLANWRSKWMDPDLIGGLAKPGTVAEMRAVARNVSNGRDHLISETILIRRDGRWGSFWTEGSPDPTGTAKSAKRPWWRFWG